MKEADCHNNFENAILSVTINFSSVQALHRTENRKVNNETKGNSYRAQVRDSVNL